MNLSTLTDRELYRLSWDISEELVQREQSRIRHEAVRRIVGRYEIARPTPKVALGVGFDNADDNYGAW